jgi:hypothetical protein
VAINLELMKSGRGPIVLVLVLVLEKINAEALRRRGRGTASLCLCLLHTLKVQAELGEREAGTWLYACPIR